MSDGLSLVAHDAHAQVLRGLIGERRVIPVVGAGVSTAAAQLPGWTDLLEDGLRHVAATGTAEEPGLSAARQLLKTGDLVGAADSLKALLGHPGGEFPAWLEDVFGESRAVDTHLLHSIFDLDAPLLVTTNYDRLLEAHHPFCNPDTVTWRQPPRMQTALQKRNGEFVLHLHGIYSDPASVVFGVADYDELVQDQAYRAVLQSLWLGETLLFVGCSIDGLKDPDFKKLVDWASAAFGATTNTHYALLPSESISTGLSRDFLHNRRIQLVGYGVDHAQLPAWIADLNPGREQAQARRAGDARDALRRGGPDDEATFTKTVEGLTPLGATVDVAAEARELFSAAASSVERARGQLIAAQRLLRGLVDLTAVDRMLEWWRGDGWRTKTSRLTPPEGFVDVVKQAGIALYLLPDELLVALKNRDVHVHGRILDGYCAELLDEMESGLPITGEDGYQRENMVRILTSFHAVVSADPTKTFPPLERGSGKVQEASSLLVVRSESVEIRPLDDPASISALLAHHPGPIGVACVQFNGQPAIATWNNESLLVWDPQRTPHPVAEHPLSQRDMGYIHAIAHDPRAERLRTLVIYSSGFVHELDDLQPIGSRSLPQNSLGVGPRITNATLGPDGRLFALLEQHSLAEIRDNDVAVLLRSEELLEQLAHYPNVPSSSRARMVGGLSVVELAGNSVLSLFASLDTTTENGGRTVEDLLIFLDAGDDLRVSSIFYTESRSPIEFAVAVDEAGTLWLHCALLYEGFDPCNVLVWAQGLQTVNGLVFVEAGSTLTIDRDLRGVVPTDAHHGFAVDDSGRLFSYSTEDRGSYEELVPSGSPDALGLLCVRWHD